MSSKGVADEGGCPVEACGVVRVAGGSTPKSVVDRPMTVGRRCPWTSTYSYSPVEVNPSRSPVPSNRKVSVNSPFRTIDFDVSDAL